MPRVCIIGAGAAGLCAAKHALHQNYEVTVYEQCDQLGGTWVYNEKAGCHSSTYEVMKTNLPKEMMFFRDEPFQDELRSFVGHSEVLKYLKVYGSGLPIIYRHNVANVKRIDTGWQVTTTCRDEIKRELFDIVFVCNGNYFAPRTSLDISQYKGFVIHSHDYRRPNSFANQKVLVVGAGPSGIDIVLQVALHAKEVQFVGNIATYGNLPGNIVQRQCRVESLSGFTARLTNGDTIHDVDSVILCTGYVMKFPFLDDDLITIKANGQLVSPLYEHVLHVRYPTSLFFIGLNHVSVTFTMLEHQVKLALSLVSGVAKVPSQDELNGWEEEHLRRQQERGLGPAMFHFLGDSQWAYYARLCELGNFDPWPYHEVMKKMWDYIFAQKKMNVVGYKNIDFIVNDGVFSVKDL